MNNFSKSLLIFLCCILCFQYSKAHQLSGGEFSWKELDNDTFEITLHVYYSCGQSIFNTEIIVIKPFGGIAYNEQLNLIKTTDVTPVQTGTCTQCIDANCQINRGIVRLTYIKKIKLDRNYCGYKLSYSHCCRILNYTTGGSGENFYIEATLNLCLPGKNNSTVYHNSPLFITSTNTCVKHDPAYTEEDGDSVVFYLSSPKTDSGVNILYSGSYNYKEPLDYVGAFGNPENGPGNTCSGFLFDSLHGIKYFNASKAGITKMAMTVEEWRRDSSGKYVLASKLVRDEALSIIDAVANKPPVFTGINFTENNDFFMHSECKKCFDVRLFDGDLDSTNINPLVLWPGMDFSIKKVGKTTVATICWQPTESQLRNEPYKVILQGEDDFYPFPARTYRTFYLYALPAKKPKAQFTADTTIQLLLNNQFKFTNTSIDSFKNASYLWFIDGKTYTTFNLNFRFSKAGKHEVKLIAKNCQFSDTFSMYVYVIEGPKANFSINDSAVCPTDFLFEFNDLSTNDSGTIFYEWNFGDGNTSNAKLPQHSYNKVGAYIVKLKITTSLGIADSVEKTIYISGTPNPEFTISDSIQCITNNRFSITPATTFSATHIWDFGDGTTATTANKFTKVYSTAGIYTIKHKVTNVDGCSDSIEYIVKVLSPPIASILIDSTEQCVDNNVFKFSGNSINAENYLWDFGDGTTSTDSVFNKIYDSAGTYHVKLKVKNGNCAESEASTTVLVHKMPVATFNVNNSIQCFENNYFNFRNTSSEAIKFNWDFGDGNNSDVAEPEHFYKVAGNYTVQLIITNRAGCTDTISENITVLPKDIAGFETENTCIGNEAKFLNTSTSANGKLVYLWNFGDGETDTSEHTQHIYAVAGEYKVTLKTTSINGCTAETEKTIQIFEKPIVGFNLQKHGRNITVSADNVVNANYFWDFGDGNTANGQTASHTYFTDGNYTVTLKVITREGCENNISKTIKIDKCLDETGTKYEWKIYPNPVFDRTIYLEGSECLSAKHIGIYDMLGRNLFNINERFNGDKRFIIPADVVRGLYTVRVVNTDGTVQIQSFVLH